MNGWSGYGRPIKDKAKGSVAGKNDLIDDTIWRIHRKSGSTYGRGRMERLPACWTGLKDLH